MPSDFSVHSSLPIPRPRSPRFFAPRTDVDVDDGIVPVDVGVVGHNHHHLQPYNDEGGDLASKLGFARLRTSPAIVTLTSAAKHHHFRSATDPLSDASPVDEEEEDSGEGYDAAAGISADMDMSLSPAAMFLSAFGAPPSLASSSPSSKTDAEEGDVVDGYTLGPVIGHGGFSVVRRATSPSSDLVAVKIVDRSSIPSSDVLTHRRLDNESAIWKTLSHEHILPLFHSFHSHTPSRRVDFFFMPLCPAGSLFDILKRDGQPDGLPHDDAGTMFRQVVRGVRYLHEQARLVHADLKLENVLVDASGSCRIADFGLACRIPDGGEGAGAPVRRQRSLFAPHGHGHGQGPRVKPRAQSNYTTSTPSTHNTNSYTNINSSSVYALPAGSLPYAAPELLRSPTPDENYTYIPRPAQDVWALGVMLHGLLTGSLPFRDGFEPRLTMKILKGFDTMPPNIGRGAELVLRACLTSDPHKRWTIAAVDDIAWSVGWDSDDVEIERMIAEALGGGEEGGSGKSRSRSRQPAVIYEDEDEFPGGAVGLDARSSSSSSSVSTSSIASPSPFVRGRGRPSSHSLSRSRSRSPSPSISSIPPSTPTDAFLVPGPDDERRDRVLERGRKARARQRSAERPAPYRRRSSQDGNSFSHSHLHSPSPDGALMSDSHSRSRSKAHTTHTRPFFERSISPRRAGSQPPPSPWAGLGRVRAGMMSKSSASVGLSPAQAVTPAPAPVTPRSGFVLGRVGVVVGKGRSLSVDAEGRR